MKPIYFDKATLPEPLARLGRSAFPSYTGHKFKLRATESLDVRSYWDGGSRDYFTFVRIADAATMPIPQQSAFDAKVDGADSATIIPGLVCVEHTIFCGKDLGLTFHCHPADIGPYLPIAPDLTDEQATVLRIISSYISRARADYFRQAGLDSAAVDRIKAELVAKGLLRKNGAITPQGRTAEAAL